MGLIMILLLCYLDKIGKKYFLCKDGEVAIEAVLV